MDRHYEDHLELLKITEIGPWKVKCRFPANQSTSVGVIGPFGEDTSNEDLTEALKEAGFKGALAERIFKGKDKIKTSMFKIIFDSNSLPPYVRIGYQQYWVNTYIGKPWQCYKCQRFGHSAAFCSLYMLHQKILKHPWTNLKALSKIFKEISRILPPMDITPSPVIGQTNPHKKTKHNTGTWTKNSTGKLHNNNTTSQNPTGTEFTNKTAKWIHKKN
ncbi:hypothetical protein FHG87_021189 [Trinorchestia longiramus]|nr:hypothetical protein FHG87_021189 [Trinorchestia longiramus]